MSNVIDLRVKPMGCHNCLGGKTARGMKSVTLQNGVIEKLDMVWCEDCGAAAPADQWNRVQSAQRRVIERSAMVAAFGNWFAGSPDEKAVFPAGRARAKVREAVGLVYGPEVRS